MKATHSHNGALAVGILYKAKSGAATSQQLIIRRVVELRGKEPEHYILKKCYVSSIELRARLLNTQYSLCDLRSGYAGSAAELQPRSGPPAFLKELCVCIVLVPVCQAALHS